jgi:glycosyltransferase involved in cell wall biosynthesis
MKVYYWSPFITEVATTSSVINSIKSINKFSKKKINCKIINVFKEWNPLENLLQKNNIQVINLKNFINIKYFPKKGFLKSRFTYLVVFFVSIINLHMLLKKEKPDYFIIHLISSIPLTLLNLFNYQSKFILRISGYPKMNFWRRFLWKICNKKINKVFCPTSSTKNLLIKKKIFSPNKLFIVNDPIIDIKNICTKKKLDLDISYNWLKDKEFILSIGRLTKQKNFDFLIDGFKEILKDLPNLNLVILGDGEDRNLLKNKILKNNLQNNIFLLGYHKNIYPFFKNSLFFVLTSEWEDPGFVILESMFARKLVLSSDCESGPQEIIKDGINGFLYKNKNMISFKERFFMVFNLIKNKQENTKEILLKGIKTSGNYSQLNHFKQIEAHIR